jgi:3-methylfumaryl-CoA hydratase
MPETGVVPTREQDWEEWVGRSRIVTDVVDVVRARAMQALLDDKRPPLEAGDALPPLWHWLYFWTLTPTAGIGPDGHARRGDFLPPIPLPRRMWGGSRVRFPGTLRIGTPAEMRSTVATIKLKEGRSGTLAFVTVQHSVSQDGAVVIEDEHDIVYRTPTPASSPEGQGAKPPSEWGWKRTIVADPVFLFRYSALTFNGHRIHYDRDYTRDIEGYPGLIVHGPLLATLMMEEARTALPDRKIEAFQFRAQAPVFDTMQPAIAGRLVAGTDQADVWVERPDGLLAMNGHVKLAL